VCSYIRKVCVCPFHWRLAEKHTPLFPDLWKSSPYSESSLTPHPAEYCGQTEKWLLIFQKIGRTYTQKKWGREKNLTRKEWEETWFGEDTYTDWALIYSYVCTRPYISNTANLMWFVKKKAKCGTIKQKKRETCPTKVTQTQNGETRTKKLRVIQLWDFIVSYSHLYITFTSPHEESHRQLLETFTATLTCFLYLSYLFKFIYICYCFYSNSCTYIHFKTLIHINA